MNWASRCAWLAVAAVFGAMLAGCGMPGAPLPPSLNLPEPVTDLSAARTGDHVSLTWTMPTKNTDKLLLKDDVEVRVCRRDSLSQSCLVAGDVKLAPGTTGAFNEELPEQFATGTPRTLTYYVQLRNRNGRAAGLSNGAVVMAGEAPAAVTGLEAEVRKQGVVLHWNDTSEGPQATAVRLERKLLTPIPAKPPRGPTVPAPEPVEQNLLIEINGQVRDRAIDRGIRFGATYEYRAQRVIRVLREGMEMDLDGPLSAPVRVEAADIFPPAEPTGLAAVAVPAENGNAPGIDLSWQPNIEPDLAGYIVYRSENSGQWRRISPAQPVAGSGFHDGQVEAGHTYEYAVTAVDQGGHEGPRSRTATETVPQF